MPDHSNDIFGYILTALDRQSKVTTTHGITEKILGTGLLVAGGWCLHLTRRISRLERRIEKMKRTEE